MENINTKIYTDNRHGQYKAELINWIAGQGFTHGLSLSHHLGVKSDGASNRLILGGAYKNSTDYRRANIIPERNRDIAKAELGRRGVSLDRAKADMKHLHRDIDRQLLGCRFNTSPYRSYGIFVFEGREDMATVHVHALLKIAPQNHAKFESLFADDVSPEQNLWQRIVPSGSHKLIPNDNPFASATYLTKHIHMNTDANRIVFSHDFISQYSKVSA